ncbi:DUF2278 family protein [Bradyrhizobium sp. DOA9]|uniref:DUF2278 family protein n=1 Tax=Bradyrhizobium sp. DOA9 TaxID=1126627 RepID=UPI00046A13A4|nr:DUF2278 family protein [Bradyrhizobium sp. DOA9]GAJ35329.1 uncharacterized conserved protein [Bradyrhizobium sp. DOA9]
MSLKHYSVLKGRPIAMRFGTGRSPHYQVHIVAGGEDFRIAVNVQSADGSEVEFLVRSRFVHPITERLAALPEGLHPQTAQPGSLALDFIRGNLMQPQEMVPLPVSVPGPDNDLNEKLDQFVQRALSDESAMVYAFGEPWGPETKADNYFGFRPGRGIHDIHMNQGNPIGRFSGDNGPWQDGGLVFEFPEQNLWTAVFLKFQTQAWHTDDETGHPIDLGGGTPTAPLDPTAPPTEEMPDGLVRVIAALVNAVKTPEREVVTLLNTADRDIDLTGWKLADKQKKKMTLSGKIAAGGTLAVEVQKPMELSNQGGIISLLDQRGIKVHGVAYTRAQAKHPGLTIPF